MNKIEYGVASSNVFRMIDCTFDWGSEMPLWIMHCAEPTALVAERTTLRAIGRRGVRLLADQAGDIGRVYVNDWFKVIDCEGRESTIGHGVYPADEFNRMVSRLSRAKYETDWRPA